MCSILQCMPVLLLCNTQCSIDNHSHSPSCNQELMLTHHHSFLHAALPSHTQNFCLLYYTWLQTVICLNYSITLISLKLNICVFTHPVQYWIAEHERYHEALILNNTYGININKENIHHNCNANFYVNVAGHKTVTFQCWLFCLWINVATMLHQSDNAYQAIVCFSFSSDLKLTL